jgi:hypothetical protein
MKKLLSALIAGAFAAVAFGALAADPYTAQPQKDKPGRAADDTKSTGPGFAQRQGKPCLFCLQLRAWFSPRKQGEGGAEIRSLPGKLNVPPLQGEGGVGMGFLLRMDYEKQVALLIGPR